MKKLTREEALAWADLYNLRYQAEEAYQHFQDWEDVLEFLGIL